MKKTFQRYNIDTFRLTTGIFYFGILKINKRIKIIKNTVLPYEYLSKFEKKLDY